MMSSKNEPQAVTEADIPHWPRIMLIRPRTVLIAVAVWLALAWAIFLIVDIFQWVDLGFDRPVWFLLFNDRPVEWTQWYVLAFAIFGCGFLSACMFQANRPLTGQFFLLFGIGIGIMLVEEAGDIRHVISDEIRRAAGDSAIGIPYKSISDTLYFALVAFFPYYSLRRYGRYVWQSVAMRPYLVSGVLLYAFVAFANATRQIGNSYVHIGAWIDNNILGGRFPIVEGMTQNVAHKWLTDSIIEESLELIAPALIVAAILAFAADFRAGRLPASENEPQSEAAA